MGRVGANRANPVMLPGDEDRQSSQGARRHTTILRVLDFDESCTCIAVEPRPAEHS